SRISASDRQSGRAPATARSLIVPCTASRPMSPPGKKSGVTTYESVVKARRAHLDERRVLERIEQRVPERRRDQLLDEIERQAAARAVAEQDLARVDERNGARAEGRSGVRGHRLLPARRGAGPTVGAGAPCAPPAPDAPTSSAPRSSVRRGRRARP